MRIVIDRVAKTYVDHQGHAVDALRDVSFSVLLPVSSGEVTFESPPPGRPLTAMVFQEFALFPWRTVQGNVEFGLDELGMAVAERGRKARALIEMTGLAGFEARYPHQLSGGMRQRVAIARALAVDSAALLMDEPFSALDAQTRQLMQDELLARWEQARTTILYVTHNIQEAVYMADRVVVLSRRPGRVLAEIVVPLKRPRTEAMQAEPGYLETVERIWSLITYAGVRQADPLLIRAAVSFGAGRLSVIRKVVLPSALPMIVAGLRLAAGTALLLLVAAEMIAVESGVGFLVLHAGNIMATTKLMVGIVVLSLLGVLSHWGLGRLERALIPWRAGT